MACNETPLSGAPDPAALPYRPCVGIMLINPHGQVWVGRRIDLPDAWQMPQGGIDPGETPRQAAFRELEEEIGTANAAFLAETDEWLRYDLPPTLIGRAWNGRWRGQEQKWIAARFLGTDAEIDLDTAHPEFDAWQWIRPERLPMLAAPFKRHVYERVLQAFERHLIPGQR